MTSEERHNARYIRRKEKRIEQKRSLNKDYDDYDKVFTYENLYTSYKKCIRGVRWKASVQKFILNAVYNIAILRKELLNNNLMIKNSYEFYIFERGKKRHIRSVGIKERIVQRCICDYSLAPMLYRTFIYDNGASIPGKGVNFSRQRLKKHIEGFKRNHDTGYVLIFDFSKYFDSIPHDLIFDILNKNYTDKRLVDLIMRFIKFTGRKKGIDLGSQISQVLALAAANSVDHIIKEKFGFKYYGRYMDDGYILSESKERLNECRDALMEYTSSIGLKLNEKKTKIVKLSKGFVFLKNRYIVDGNKTIIIPTKSSAVRMRRKLKKLTKKVNDNTIPYNDVLQSFSAWASHFKGTRCYRTMQSMTNLFNKLLIEPFTNDYERYVAQADWRSDNVL